METVEFPETQLSEIEKYDFTIMEHNQPWRFVRGTAKKGNQIYFFKISPDDEKLTQRLQKEISFNQTITTVIKQSNQSPPFRVPKVISTHFTPTSNWAILEYFPGELLAKWTPARDPQDLENWLVKISDTLIFLDSIKINNIQLDHDSPYPKPVNEYMVDLMKTWAEKPLQTSFLKKTELNQLVDLVVTAPPLPNCLQHGDFVPWHMISLDQTFGLIDSEAASIYKPRFYDLAYFYHRVFTKLWQPSIAQKFFKMFMDRSGIDSRQLTTYFLPVLAQRCTGGMFDYLNTHKIHDPDKTEYSLHRQLLRLILKTDLNGLMNK